MADERRDELAGREGAKGAFVRALAAELEEKAEAFRALAGRRVSLTRAEKRRLVGPGVRNNGFIDAAFDIATDNPQFMPPQFDFGDYAESKDDFEDLRQLLLALRQFEQAVNNDFLIRADRCYRYSLRVYGGLEEQTRSRVPGAEPLFDALKSFFSRGRKSADGAPTEKQLLRDAKRLARGKADGEVVVRHESPKAEGGVREVVDEIKP